MPCHATLAPGFADPKLIKDSATSGVAELGRRMTASKLCALFDAISARHALPYETATGIDG
jgi:hypothetical protein